MNSLELRETLCEKDKLLRRQTKRIDLLESKFNELRKKYFNLKYANVILPVKPELYRF